MRDEIDRKKRKKRQNLANFYATEDQGLAFLNWLIPIVLLLQFFNRFGRVSNFSHFFFSRKNVCSSIKDFFKFHNQEVDLCGVLIEPKPTEFKDQSKHFVQKFLLLHINSVDQDKVRKEHSLKGLINERL